MNSSHILMQEHMHKHVFNVPCRASPQRCSDERPAASESHPATFDTGTDIATLPAIISKHTVPNAFCFQSVLCCICCLAMSHVLLCQSLVTVIVAVSRIVLTS